MEQDGDGNINELDFDVNPYEMDIINSDDDMPFPQTPPANEDSDNMGSDIEEVAKQE